LYVLKAVVGEREIDEVLLYGGKDGTTYPDGWVDTPANNWRPDLKKMKPGLPLKLTSGLKNVIE
jgi:hypothetical protein